MEISDVATQIPFGQKSFVISDAVHVDATRRAIIRDVSRMTSDETLLGRLTVLVQELTRNLLIHAGGGELVCCLTPDKVELVAIDEGPGMVDIAQCLADHYSTAGTMGAGLGAIRRMADEFDLFSRPQQGTVVYAGVWVSAGNAARTAAARSNEHDTTRYVASAISTPYPGEEVCGDAWAIKDNRIMVCDGLGHGHAANAASQRARHIFLNHDPRTSVVELMERLHEALLTTRGGALAIAEIQPAAGQVQFCGVGNIAGKLLDSPTRSMVSGNGTLGYKVGRFQIFTYPWTPAVALTMASDGLSAKFDVNDYPGLKTRHPAVMAAVLHRDFKRLNDDATVVVVKVERH